MKTGAVGRTHVLVGILRPRAGEREDEGMTVPPDVAEVVERVVAGLTGFTGTVTVTARRPDGTETVKATIYIRDGVVIEG